MPCVHDGKRYADVLLVVLETPDHSTRYIGKYAGDARIV